MNELPRDIRCVVIPSGPLRLILPNAIVAEVAPLNSPTPVDMAPAWLLGRTPWRGHQVPLLSFARLIGADEIVSDENRRIAILRALYGRAGQPFIAMVIHGAARLISLTAEQIIPSYDRRAMPPGVKAWVWVHGDKAVIPDFQMIEEALAGNALQGIR